LHQSVLLDASIEGLAIKPDGIYVDGTFGRGGHSRAILDRLGPNGRLIAIDKDDAAILHAGEYFIDERFSIYKRSFAELEALLTSLSLLGQIDGVLLDLGVSSPQLDEADRGFSFMHDGPLDMRMDRQNGITAAEFVNTFKAQDMAKVFKEYGEERFAKRIANAIETARVGAPFETTLALAEVVKAANPRWEKHKHPATRVFQAIRIYVNRELEDLKIVLDSSIKSLKKNGRLAVISFHSLEDRIVKQFMKNASQGPYIPKEVPVRACEIKMNFKCIGKAIKPSAIEVEENIRSRSAVLRIGEKLL
jgi:16S rRNA (cytosine1402-N4)-methyltransferase